MELLGCRHIYDRSSMLGPMSDLDIASADKRVILTGLQITDLIARPIEFKTLRPDQPNRAYGIIDNKLR